MMRRALLILLLFLWPALAWGQLPSAIVLGGAKPTPADVAQAKAVIAAAEEKELTWNVGEFDVIVRGPQASGVVTFDSTDDSILTLDEIPAGVLLWMNDVRAGQKERQLHKFPGQKESYWVARAAKEGRCTIKVWANGENGAAPRIIARLDVQVGKPKPPPLPPGPQPGPNPPLPALGLRVLIVYETEQNIPQQQSMILTSQIIFDYLKAKCAKENGRPEFRIFDKDVSVANQSQIWQDAMKRPRQTLPWILISDGKTGYEGPLPANVNDTLKLLKQYGGE